MNFPMEDIGAYIEHLEENNDWEFACLDLTQHWLNGNNRNRVCMKGFISQA